MVAFSQGTVHRSWNRFFYSFCKKEWVNEEDYRHCSVCRKCHSVHVSWHFGVCKQCRRSGLDKPCHRCGGTSSKANPESNDDIGDLGGEIGLARICALIYGGTLQPQVSETNEPIASLPSITASLFGPLGDLSNAIDEQTPLKRRTPSPIRDLLHGDSRGANTQLITRDTSTAPIIASQARMPRGFGNAMPAARAHDTASDLGRHMRYSSHNLFGISSGSSRQSSRNTDVIKGDIAKFTHRTIEDRHDRECECHDGCRLSNCRCAAAGTICSLNCRCNIDTDDDKR